MLLQIDGETLLRRAARRAQAAGLDPVMVVTGHRRDEAEAEIAGTGAVSTHNPHHAEGIHTSLQAGIAALESDARYADVAAVMTLLPDMPFVTTAMLRELAGRYRAGDAALLISRYGGDVQAPPMLYDRALFCELRVVQQHCGREVVQRHREEADVLDWPAEALADIDTPDDYTRIRATIEAGSDDAAASAPAPRDTTDES